MLGAGCRLVACVLHQAAKVHHLCVAMKAVNALRAACFAENSSLPVADLPPLAGIVGSFSWACWRYEGLPVGESLSGAHSLNVCIRLAQANAPCPWCLDTETPIKKLPALMDKAQAAMLLVAYEGHSGPLGAQAALASAKACSAARTSVRSTPSTGVNRAARASSASGWLCSCAMA